jgi:N-acetylmuramoyl-L-alanine amidase
MTDLELKNKLQSLKHKLLKVIDELESLPGKISDIIEVEWKPNATVIAIRAGHGGIDPITGEYTTKGKRFTHPHMDNLHSKDGKTFYEGVWNRAIANLVHKKLTSLQIPSILIHHEYKDESLRSQVDKINHIHKHKHPIALLLELHSNACSSHKAEGFEVYTSPGETSSDKYATLLFQMVSERLPIRPRTDMSDGDPDREKNFTMIAKTWCPAILPEFLFFDNKNDIKIIMDPLIMDQYAEILAQVSAQAYFDSKK